MATKRLSIVRRRPTEWTKPSIQYQLSALAASPAEQAFRRQGSQGRQELPMHGVGPLDRLGRGPVSSGSQDLGVEAVHGRDKTTRQ